MGLLLTDAFHVVGAKTAGRFADASPQEFATPQAQATSNTPCVGARTPALFSTSSSWTRPADFEVVMAKLKEALQRSDKPGPEATSGGVDDSR